jgi:NAD(P)-dependent dehydrogenase (short-subunit alcohol dehydrogenase family)
MTDAFSLAGRRALVTGANTGIGQAIAVALAGAGAEVICAARSPATETLDLIATAGGRATALALDFADPMAGRDAFATLGPVDILVNNAGIIRRADAVDFTEADWDAVIDVNLKAAFFTCQGFARAAFARGAGGSIINIASLLSFQGGIRVPSYRLEARRRRPHPAPRQRMGRARHQRQRHRAWLHRHQQHRGAAQRSRSQPGDPRPDPRRPLGRGLGHRRHSGLPRLPRGALYSWRRHPRRRRLACPLRPSPCPA